MIPKNQKYKWIIILGDPQISKDPQITNEPHIQSSIL